MNVDLLFSQAHAPDRMGLCPGCAAVRLTPGLPGATQPRSLRQRHPGALFAERPGRQPEPRRAFALRRLSRGRQPQPGRIFGLLLAGVQPAGWLSAFRAGLPHGEPDKVTYHLGVLAIIEALVDPTRSLDFWQAYAQLLAAYKVHAKRRS